MSELLIGAGCAMLLEALVFAVLVFIIARKCEVALREIEEWHEADLDALRRDVVRRMAEVPQTLRDQIVKQEDK